VHQTGGSKSALLARISERADLQRRAMRGNQAIIVDAKKNPEMIDPRWHEIGVEAKSILCAPVVHGGRYLGLIELCNPHDGKAFKESDGHALTYIGNQFGQYLNERGILLDPEAILAQAKSR
jgi:GAF domain-containing protein